MTDVIIIGAGLAGLTCARRLQEIGRSFVILEAADAVGGRVRTDVVDGFRLDRGFQVLLTAYPECRRSLDYHGLKLHNFIHGALIRFGGRFHRFVDPRRDPLRGLGTMLGSVGTVGDKWKLLRLETKLRAFQPEQLFEQPEGLTLDLLRWQGFTDSMIDRFFKPFFGGVFLEKDLVTSSRLFRFVYRMFSAGAAAVPELGMQAIPEQLASRLPADAIRLNQPVARIESRKIILQTGATLECQAIVVATDEPAAAKLLGWPAPAKFRGVTCLYFAAPESPIKEPILILNADNSGPVHNMVVMSEVSPSLAPAGQSLISATILDPAPPDDSTLQSLVRQQMTAWFGESVSAWKHLKTYRIPYALPDQTAPALDEPQRPVRVSSGIFVCGDHRDNASINGAMQSGWRAAQAVGEDLHAIPES